MQLNKNIKNLWLSGPDHHIRIAKFAIDLALALIIFKLFPCLKRSLSNTAPKKQPAMTSRRVSNLTCPEIEPQTFRTDSDVFIHRKWKSDVKLTDYSKRLPGVLNVKSI